MKNFLKLTTGLHYFYLGMYTFSLTAFFSWITYLVYDISTVFALVIAIVGFIITFMTTAAIDIFTSDRYQDLG